MATVQPWSLVVEKPAVKPKAEKGSRQRAWQEARRAEGKCTLCGKEPLLKGSTTFCGRCLERRRARQRKKLGIKAWVAGGPGRPPIRVKREIMPL